MSEIRTLCLKIKLILFLMPTENSLLLFMMPYYMLILPKNSNLQSIFNKIFLILIRLIGETTIWLLFLFKKIIKVVMHLLSYKCRIMILLKIRYIMEGVKAILLERNNLPYLCLVLVGFLMLNLLNQYKDTLINLYNP